MSTAMPYTLGGFLVLLAGLFAAYHALVWWHGRDEE